MKYSPDIFYPLNSLVTHPAFGTGKVIEHIPPNKMDVDFDGCIRCLVCGKISWINRVKRAWQTMSIVKFDKQLHDTQEKNDQSSYNDENVNIESKDEYSSDCTYVDVQTVACSYGKNNTEYHSIINEMRLVGLDQNDIRDAEILQKLLTEWDYGITASAQTAYTKPSIERLQLLRQIAGLLQNGMGFSQLFNMLEPRRGLPTRAKANAIGKTLQPWSGLFSSVSLRSFVKEHENFLGGRVINGKWETDLSALGSGILDNHVSQAKSRIPLSENAKNENGEGYAVLNLGASTTQHALDKDMQTRATHIVTSKFKNGYHIASNIDFEKFINFYADEYGEIFAYSAGDLDTLMVSVAMIFDDKAYIYDTDVTKTIRNYLEQVNSPVISADAFFENFSEEFYGVGIFSTDMLRAFIEKNYPNISWKWDYIYLHPDASAATLIREAFNEREIWTFDELANRLPYLKPNTIQQALNGSAYCRIAPDGFTHVDNMDLPESEGEKVISFVKERLQAKGYLIAKELDISKFENLNPHCPTLAIQDAVFNKFLSHRYKKSRQVITPIGKTLPVLNILEEHCRGLETMPFEELLSFGASLSPESQAHHGMCLTAAHSCMVRVSKELFVAVDKVYFDIGQIDEIISFYCQDDFIPLKKVVDFSLFSYAGYPWNLFLLESYVRKFSRFFKYDAPTANSVNIGVIVRNSLDYAEYEDILAIALAKSGISLDSKKAADDFLFDSGYIGRRRPGKRESKILVRAKELREKA